MKTKTDATTMAREAMAGVSKSKLTLTQEAVMNYVMMFLNFIFAEFFEKRKRFYTPESLLREDAVAEMQKDVLGKSFGSDRAMLNACFTCLSKYLWGRTNREEGEYIVKQLKEGDEKFARTFFFDNKEKGMNIARLRSRLIMEMAESYGELLKDIEVGDIIYLALWKDGSWQPLDTFKAESSIFSWIGTIARHAIVNTLEEEGRIKKERERTVGNVRISKSKLTPERCQFILDNEPLPIDVRNLIEKLYMDCMTDQQIMRHYGWDEDTYNKKVKKATDRLKDSLLRSPHCYDDVLKDRDPRHITMSLEGAKDFGAWVVDHSNFSSLEGLFGVNLTDAEIQEKAQELMQHISANMEWSDNDRIVWQRRFFENQSPEELADELHMRRSNVDNIYSRCKRKFNAAMQKWYETRTNCKVHKMKKEPKTKKQTKTRKAA